MKNSAFTIDQITKLREIEKARIRQGEPGLCGELQTLIRRLTSGGVGVKTDDPREAQARRLWNKGFGELSFPEYLATIPSIPDFPANYVGRFPRLVLVDARLPITKQCELLGVLFVGNDETYEDFDPNTAKTEKVYWIRAQDGHKNISEPLRAYRESFAEDEVGLSAYEGLALYAQNPKDLKGRSVYLSGSVLRAYSGIAACLVWVDGRLRLVWHRDDHVAPNYGSASRGK